MNANADLDALETAECLHALTPVQAHNCIQLQPDLGSHPVDPAQREGAYAPHPLTAATTPRMHRPTPAATARSKSTATRYCHLQGHRRPDSHHHA